MTAAKVKSAKRNVFHFRHSGDTEDFMTLHRSCASCPDLIKK